jgi:glycosyltransferase involved in cell wall biosynthesis
VPLARQLHQRGHLAQFITTRAAVRREFGDLVTAIPVPEYLGWAWRRLPLVGRWVPFNVIKDNLFDRMARRRLQPCDLFVVWANYGLSSLRRARQLGARVILERGSAHVLKQREILQAEYARFGLRWPYGGAALLEKQLREYEEADSIVVPSEFAAQSFFERGVPRNRVHVVPYGVDAERFRPGPVTEKGPFRILFVGNIGIEKGVQYLLEAVRLLGLADAELVLIGNVDASGRLLLRRYAGTYRHVPHADQERLAEWYRRSSVFVLPSLHEGHAMVTSEAMASGLPVIVSSRTGAVVRDGTDGFVIPPGSAAAIAEKLDYLFQHPAVALEMGRVGRARITTGYTWAHYGERVTAVYRQVLGQAT